MPVFAYEALNKDAQKVKGDITANSKDEAIKLIQSKGLRPTRLQQQKGEPAKKAVPVVEQLAPKKKSALFKRGVRSHDIVTFTTQLSTLQDAGLPIVRSLKILEDQQKPGKFKDQLEAIADEVEQGIEDGEIPVIEDDDDDDDDDAT